jgi:catechol 2,3-dioxygenase-like lactoylglutathione lyase family enzyme
MRYILAAVLVMSSLHAQTQTNVPRPHLPGLAHVAFRVSDMERTSAFYESLLGYEEPFSLKDSNGKITLAFVKVNDLQYVELFQGDARSQGQFDHFALYTDDLTAMRAYLSAQKVPIVEDIHQGRIGNSFLTIRDPDGHPVEILQYSKTSLTARSQGKFMPAGRVSSHITHVGILVSSVGSAMKFYRDMLGFREFLRGTGGGNGQPGWVDLQTPDGGDYIELIPYSGVPTPAYLKAQNHFSLVSSDIQKTIASLQTRATTELQTSSLNVENGGSLPPRTNLFDPDGARIEIMEPMSAASAIATSYP